MPWHPPPDSTAPPDLPDLIRDYGAKGDGSDDSSAFSRAHADSIPGYYLRAGHVYGVSVMPQLPDGMAAYASIRGDEGVTPTTGAIIRALNAMESAFQVAGNGCRAYNITADAATLANQGFDALTNDSYLHECHGHRALVSGYRINGNRNRALSGYGVMASNVGNAIYTKGADNHLTGLWRARSGLVPMRVDGSTGVYVGAFRCLGDQAGVLADLDVTNGGNKLIGFTLDSVPAGVPHMRGYFSGTTGCYGNRFLGFTVISPADNGTGSVVTLDSSGGGSMINNDFLGWQLNPSGAGWASFLKEIGGNTYGNTVGPGKYSGCALPYDMTTAGKRPYFVYPFQGSGAKIGSGGWDQHAQSQITMVSSATWTNMPAALTEFTGVALYRTLQDVRYFTQARLIGRVTTVGVAGSKIWIQYSTDEATWNDLDAAAATGVGYAINAAGTKDSGWVDIAGAAMTRATFFRIVGSGGDGAADPVFGTTVLEFR